MVSPAIQNLARRLIASEAARHEAPDATAPDATAPDATAPDATAPDATAPENAVTRVIEKLRARLVRLAGTDGFRSLLSRALNLAKAEAPALNQVSVCADGLTKGFDEIVRTETQTATEAAEQAGAILVAHLLELLVTFIGEPLTLQLLRDAWPEASMNGAHLNIDLNIIKEQL